MGYRYSVMKTLFLFVISCLLSPIQCAIISIEDYGAISDDMSSNMTNRDALNAAFDVATNGDIVLIPEGTWHLVGGVLSSSRNGVTLRVDGTLNFLADFDSWPQNRDGNINYYMNAIEINDSANFTITSSVNRGFINGNGKPWWNGVLLNQLPSGDSRPRLLKLNHCSDILVENITLINSAQNTFVINSVRAEVRYLDVIIDRRYESIQTEFKKDIKEKVQEQEHSIINHHQNHPPFPWLQPEDLNTDGIDVSGIDIYIHHINILNDDDSIAVKPSEIGTIGLDGTVYNCTSNILIEYVQLTGFGASIGSVPPSENRKCVNNVTFRHVNMPYSGKGIYIKSNRNSCTESNVSSQLTNLLFEDFLITRPIWWAIWIGPQQQHQPYEPLAGNCALAYPVIDSCPSPACADFHNITLRNIVIIDPLLSPGVLMGNASNPMKNIIFQNVSVKDSGNGTLNGWPFNGTYDVHNVQGKYSNCEPVPLGFLPL